MKRRLTALLLVLLCLPLTACQKQQNLYSATWFDLFDTVAIVQGYADSLPYDDNSFDIVTCIQSFHHYPDPDKQCVRYIVCSSQTDFTYFRTQASAA